MEENKASIRKINNEIKGALGFWSDMLTISDADEWSYHLEYDDKDLLNALYIFNHIAQNIAIKSGYLNEENVEERVLAFREGVKEGFGFDTVELTDKVLKKNEEGRQRA